MNEKHYELITKGLNDETRDIEQVRKILKEHFGLHENEAELIIHQEHCLNGLFLDQARHLAKEFNALGIVSEIRKKASE